MKELERKDLGDIILGSSVIITDPGYAQYIWCNATLRTVKPGKYHCWVNMSDEGKWGHRVAELCAAHVTADYERLKDTEVEIAIGVDSGQAGIFDEAYFKEHTGKKNWYGQVCDTTTPAGTLDGFCVVSSSGFGDGAYNLFVRRNSEGIVVYIKVVFITEDEEEEVADE